MQEEEKVAINLLSNQASQTFKKSNRLLKRYEFQRLQYSSTTLSGKYLVLDYNKESSGFAKLGITVTKKFGKAHDRNRFKRIARETFRKSLSTLEKTLQVHIRPKHLAKEASYQLISEEIISLLHKVQK